MTGGRTTGLAAPLTATQRGNRTENVAPMRTAFDIAQPRSKSTNR